MCKHTVDSWSNIYVGLSVGNHLHTESWQKWTTGASGCHNLIQTTTSFQMISEGQNSLISRTPVKRTDLRTLIPAYHHCSWLKRNKTCMKHPPKTHCLWSTCVTPCTFRSCRCLSSYWFPTLCALSPRVTSMNLLPVSWCFFQQKRKIRLVKSKLLVLVGHLHRKLFLKAEFLSYCFHTVQSSKGQ